jgi:hypothetical protein
MVQTIAKAVVDTRAACGWSLFALMPVIQPFFALIPVVSYYLGTVHCLHKVPLRGWAHVTCM